MNSKSSLSARREHPVHLLIGSPSQATPCPIDQRILQLTEKYNYSLEDACAVAVSESKGDF